MEKSIFKKGLGIFLLLSLLTLLPLSAAAQKFALVDMEYIFKNIPAYERANEQLNQVSKKWQAEVEALNTEASIRTIRTSRFSSLKSRKRPSRSRS